MNESLKWDPENGVFTAQAKVPGNVPLAQVSVACKLLLALEGKPFTDVEFNLEAGTLTATMDTDIGVGRSYVPLLEFQLVTDSFAAAYVVH